MKTNTIGIAVFIFLGVLCFVAVIMYGYGLISALVLWEIWQNIAKSNDWQTMNYFALKITCLKMAFFMALLAVPSLITTFLNARNE